MSVAFRRESDEEHLEPKFELPIAPGPNLVTPRGLAMIKAEVARLEPIVATSDDPKALLGERRELRYWRARLVTAQIAPVPRAGEVGIGSRVSFTLSGKQRTIEIVGGDEADPAKERVAFTAPVARAMMGLSAGEKADFGSVEDAIEVVAVDTPANIPA
jgi:transcription elongation GreA/GreB family factor